MPNVFYKYGKEERIAVRVDGDDEDTYYLLLPQTRYTDDIIHITNYEDWVSHAKILNLKVINLPSQEPQHVLWNIVELASPDGLELINVDRLIKRVMEHPLIYINTEEDKRALVGLVKHWLGEMFE